MRRDLWRGREETICYRGARGPVSAGAFLDQATALAARLPESGYAVNLCADRYFALLGFMAALLRGHPTLLGGGPSATPAYLDMVTAGYPGAYAMLDHERPGTELPIQRVDAPWEGGRAEWPGIPMDRVAAIAFTSGSTGQPTAHTKPWGAFVAATMAAAERFGLRDEPVASLVATVPPQHMYGFETTMLLPLLARTAIHSGATFFPSDVRDALEAVPERRILVTTPLHLRAMLADRRPMPRLEAVISATAPLPRETAEAVERDWGTPMLEIYGASEAGSMASRRTIEDERWLPYSGVSLRPGVANVPGLGDVALSDELEFDADGRFRLLGRLSDVVKLGGKRASLAELNRTLAAVQGVLDGVFVAPEDLDSNPTSRLTAYVVAPGRSAEDILVALRGRVDPAFLPRRMILVDALPRDGLGKLPRQALAALG
ncbi:AMP-binding protein [Roseococcus sp. YIM B11640]|uniref:AMP-binding protein n=1 Tax=Roseococcus sp. YIM B11640 TaxID=3133973 RepID=UPI003C7A4697